jgi:hypothetical protein
MFADFETIEFNEEEDNLSVSLSTTIHVISAHYILEHMTLLITNPVV